MGVEKDQSLLSSANTNGKNIQFKYYPYRILITFIYSVACIISGMCWVVVTPIAVPIQQAYNVSSSLVSFLPMSFLIFYLFVNFPSNWVIDVKGVRLGVGIGAGGTFVGCLIRCLVGQGFVYVIIGQVLCAIAQPFLMNAPMKIASRWYLPQNRSFAMVILSAVGLVGSAIGFIVPSFFVTSDNTLQQVKSNFYQLNLLYAIISGLTFALVLFFFKERPPTLPSLSSMVESTDFTKSIGEMFCDRKFMTLALCFGTINGCFNVYGSLMDDILDPYGMTPSQVSLMGFLMMFVGIITAVFLGVYVQRTLKYRNTFILCGTIGITTSIVLPLLLYYLPNAVENYWLYFLVVICQGFIFIPLQPLTIDYGSNTMFPIGQAQITGFMISVGQVFGIIFVEIAQLFFGLGRKDMGNIDEVKDAVLKSVIFSNVIMIIGCLVLMREDRELKKTLFERGENGSDEDVKLNDGQTIQTIQKQ